MFTEDESIEILRNYRHIYMNDLQVILGYLQIGEHDKAIQYIKKISIAIDAESKVYRINDNKMKYVLIKGHTKARENFISLFVEINDEDNVAFKDEDYVYIEKELDKYIRQAVSENNAQLRLRLGYNGNAFIERLNR